MTSNNREWHLMNKNKTSDNILADLMAKALKRVCFKIETLLIALVKIFPDLRYGRF